MKTYFVYLEQRFEGRYEPITASSTEAVRSMEAEVKGGGAQGL